MVDTVTVTKLQEGAKHVDFQFTNNSDGTGESTVTKIDISTLTSDGRTPVRLSLISIEGNSIGMITTLLWDHTSDVVIGEFSGDVIMSFDKVGGKHDTGSGGTGDILITTTGHTSGDSYNLITKWRKKFT